MIDKVGIYVRNSTPDQKKQRTEENQVHDLKEWLKDLPVTYDDDDIYIDTAQSGGSTTRENYNLLISRLDQYEAVATWDGDRLVRDIDLGLELVLKLRAGNKKLYEWRNRKIYDLHNFADLFMHVNFMMMSSEEKVKAGQRREAGMLRYMREHGAPATVTLTPETLAKYWPHRPEVTVNWKRYDELKPIVKSDAAIARLMNIKPRTLYAKIAERKKKAQDPAPQ